MASGEWLDQGQGSKLPPFKGKYKEVALGSTLYVIVIHLMLGEIVCFKEIDREIEVEHDTKEARNSHDNIWRFLQGSLLTQF